MNDAISNQRLAAGCPELIARVNAAEKILLALPKPIDLRVAECLRTYAQSDADFALGRTVLKKADGTHQGIVTNAKGGQCWHNFAMAVDCYPFLDGDSGPLDWNASDPEFQAMVAAMEQAGLAWGGAWHSIKDYPHFQLAEISASPTDADRATFAAGGLAAVWKRYA